jgi:hypothetical protein
VHPPEEKKPHPHLTWKINFIQLMEELKWLRSGNDDFRTCDLQSVRKDEMRKLEDGGSLKDESRKEALSLAMAAVELNRWLSFLLSTASSPSGSRTVL